jgi:hypothetical protein
MFQPFAIFGLYLGERHTIPDTIEIDPDAFDLDDFTAIDLYGYDWDYLYQPGDMVEDETGRVGIIQFLTAEDGSPYLDDERYYFVVGLHGEYADYLLPDQIRYAVGRSS